MATHEAERLEMLLEVGRLLSSKLELEELLTTVMQLASRVVDAETASLLLLDEASQELYFDVALGLDEPASKTRLKVGQGIAGAVARTRAAEIINDARADPRWSAVTDDHSGFVTRSILAVPILHKGRLIGVVEAINKRDGAFDDGDRQAFEAFASQAGVAIENARLFQSLREEKFKLATIFSEMRDGVLLAEADGRVILANDAAQRLLGTKTGDLASAFAGLAVTPPLDEMLSGAAPTADFAAVREEPTRLVVAGQAAWAPLGGRDGRLFVFRDDTEARRQEGLKRSFLSLISHKLKTPLSAVIGYSDILLARLEESGAPELERKAARSIREQGAKVAELVDKLIRYTMLESPDAAPVIADVAVDDAVAEALAALRERIAAQGARVDYQKTALVLAADRGMLVEVVKNLVENALKFDSGPAPTVAVRVQADVGWAALSVTDLGPGVPPEAQAAVFSRFHQIEKDFTGQKEGIGLGLAFVKKVAQLHGGDAILRSQLGAGTTVTVTWPRRRPA